MASTVAQGLRLLRGTALSRGAGYEALPRVPVRRRDVVDEYFIDYSAKTASPPPVPGATPATYIQWALGWWERRRRGDARAGEEFASAAEAVLALGEPSDDGLRWRYDVPVPKYGLSGPWYSALAQGQAASVLIRAFLATRDDAFGDAAARAVVPLVRRSELVAETEDGPVLEEAPTVTSSRILNGWILALWGLRDVARALDDADADAAYETGVETLERAIGRYDVGWWTRYSLYPHRVRDLSKPIYHRFHVAQVEAMHELTGIGAFRETAARWRAYDTAPHVARALAQKGVYIAAGGRRP